MRQAQGFTLIELLVTVVLAAILLTWGVPSFRAMITNNRIAGQGNSLMAAINTARSAAVSRSTSVSVCPSTNGQSCTTGTSANWASGWIVFTDANNSGVLNSSNQVIQSSTADSSGTTTTASEVTGLASSGGTLTAFTVVSSGTPSYLSYLPSGLLANGPATGDVYMLFLKPQVCSGQQALGVVVNPLGQPASMPASCKL